MNIAIWIAIAVPIVLSSSGIFTSSGRPDEHRLAKHSGRMGLPLPETLRAPVLDRIRRRERIQLWFGIGGLAVGAIVGLLIELFTGWENAGGPLVFLGAATGQTLGAYRSLRRMRSALVPGAPRVARSVATAADDYSTGPERFATRAAAVVIALAAVAAIVLTVWAQQRGLAGWPQSLLALAVCVVTGACWALLWRAERTAVAQAQFASSDLELAWDDAERAIVVRELRAMQVALATLPAIAHVVIALAAANDAATDLTQYWPTLLAGAFGVVAVVVLLTVLFSGHTTRNPSLRLWRGTSFEAAA